MFEKEEVVLITSYFPMHSGKQLKIIRGRAPSTKMIVYRHNLEIETEDVQFGSILMLCNDGSNDVAIIEHIVSTTYDPAHLCHYYDTTSYNHSLSKIPLKNIITYAIEIRSLDKRTPSRVNLIWHM